MLLKFKEIGQEFLNFIKNKRIVIHNAEFDLSHLNNELSIAGLEKINIENVVDTLQIARDKYPGSNASLDALCKRFRIDNSRREKHSALIDCELLVRVYVNLLDQKEPSFNLKNSDDNINNQTLINNSNYSKKIVEASKEEISSHESFIKKKMKKNFF